jgi:hypothetical protein
MENGYKDWPIVRRLLIDNRLQHSALLAYSIGVSEQVFMMRARQAYRVTESWVNDGVQAANDAAADLQVKLEYAIKAEEEKESSAPNEPPAAKETPKAEPAE